MSEEEKAIEILKYTRDRCIEESGNGRIYFYRIEDLSNAIETIINLIEKQQKEIEELKEEHNSKYYHTLKLKELENEINNDWENKIKAEIKELEQMGLDDDIFGKMRNYAILILKELLGE